MQRPQHGRRPITVTISDHVNRVFNRDNWLHRKTPPSIAQLHAGPPSNSRYRPWRSRTWIRQIRPGTKRVDHAELFGSARPIRMPTVLSHRCRRCDPEPSQTFPMQSPAGPEQGGRHSLEWALVEHSIVSTTGGLV